MFPINVLHQANEICENVKLTLLRYTEVIPQVFALLMKQPYGTLYS